MPSATNVLPSDPDALRALAISLQEQLALKDRELHAKTLHIEKLRATLALMKRARFGRSSEKIDQLELLIGDVEEAAADDQARAIAARPASSGGPAATSPRSKSTPVRSPWWRRGCWIRWPVPAWRSARRGSPSPP